MYDYYIYIVEGVSQKWANQAKLLWLEMSDLKTPICKNGDKQPSEEIHFGYTAHVC